MIKLTFLGDLTCDRLQLKAARREDGSFDFDSSLREVPSVFSGSDLVIGNFETVCGGKKYGYNPWSIGYNSPDELLYAFKRMGVNVMTTANNHSLDRYKKGLIRTLRLMDKEGIRHTGTFISTREKRYLVLEVNGKRIGFVAFADGINKTAEGTLHSQGEMRRINHIRYYPKRTFKDAKISWLAPVTHIREKRRKESDERAKVGIKTVKARVDDDVFKPEDQAGIDRFIEVLKEARQSCDYLVACVHTGGQFNGEPGSHCKEIYDRLKPYADAFIGNHAHVAQRVEAFGDKGVLAYCLGGLNMSISGDYVTHDDHPEFSLAVHLYLKDGDDDSIALEKATVSLFCIEEDENFYPRIHPVDKPGCPGDNDAMREVFKRVMGYEFPGFQIEYPVKTK